MATRLLNFFTGKDDDLVISEPTSFRQEAHVGWNPETLEFEVRNLIIFLFFFSKLNSKKKNFQRDYLQNGKQ